MVGVTSADMLPVIQAVESLFDMPKAKRCDPPWQEYHHVPEVIAEMNRAESQIWNEESLSTRNWVTASVVSFSVVTANRWRVPTAGGRSGA